MEKSVNSRLFEKEKIISIIFEARRATKFRVT